MFWGKELQFIETIWYKEKSRFQQQIQFTQHTTCMLLQQPMKKQMSRKMKAPSGQGRCRPVQIVQQGVKRGRSNISYMRWRGTITREKERDKGKRTVKKKRWRKHATRSRHYIKIWFAPYGSDGFVVIGHDLCAQEPDDLQATSPRLAHTFIISDYVN